MMEMANLKLFQRLKFWGLILMIVTVVAFLAGVGLTLSIASGINGLFTLSAIYTALIGLAVIWVLGFLLQIYGVIKIRSAK
jgi:uncharacterized membrane protein YhaH (DUF805 family)